MKPEGTSVLSVFSERVHTLNHENQLRFQRSLVDLALADRHDYWDVETLDEAIQEFGFATVIRKLQESGNSLSTRVLIEALHQTALQVQEWSEMTLQYRFLTLWRERCQNYGWEEQARLTEGLMFDYRMPSLQRKVVLAEHPKPRLNVQRIGLVATKDGNWLLDVSIEGIRTWDCNTGEEGPFWSVEKHIVHVLPDSASSVWIATVDGTIYRWDVLFQLHQELVCLDSVITTFSVRNGSLVIWTEQTLLVMDEIGTIKHRLDARFRHTPVVAQSADGQRIMACDGSTLGVWSALTGSVIFGMGFHSGLSVDEVNQVESILDIGSTEMGLRLLDRLDVWGLKLSTQYATIQSLSVPIAMSEDEQFVLLADGDSVAWLEWDSVLEEFVVLSQMEVDALWSVQSILPIASNVRSVVGLSTNGLLAVDLQQQKLARYPLSMPLGSKLTVVPTTGLIVCDDTTSLSFYLFRAD